MWVDRISGNGAIVLVVIPVAEFLFFEYTGPSAIRRATSMLAVPALHVCYSAAQVTMHDPLACEQPVLARLTNALAVGRRSAFDNEVEGGLLQGMGRHS